jgi:hypothetical protein
VGCREYSVCSTWDPVGTQEANSCGFCCYVSPGLGVIVEGRIKDSADGCDYSVLSQQADPNND